MKQLSNPFVKPLSYLAFSFAIIMLFPTLVFSSSFCDDNDLEMQPHNAAITSLADYVTTEEIKEKILIF